MKEQLNIVLFQMKWYYKLTCIFAGETLILIFFSFFSILWKLLWWLASPQSLTIPINWKLCVICQLKTSEPLQCPASSKWSDKGDGYRSFSESIKSFQDLSEMPLDFDPNKIDDGSGIEKSLIEYKASWHKSYRNKFNGTEIKRALKRKASDFNEKKTLKTVHVRRGGQALYTLDSQIVNPYDVSSVIE